MLGQVYDCVNARELLDVKDYLVGVVLPPHLSPFVEEGEDDYIPPERVQLLQRVEDQGEYVKLNIFGVICTGPALPYYFAVSSLMFASQLGAHWHSITLGVEFFNIAAECFNKLCPCAFDSWSLLWYRVHHILANILHTNRNVQHLFSYELWLLLTNFSCTKKQQLYSRCLWSVRRCVKLSLASARQLSAVILFTPTRFHYVKLCAALKSQIIKR